MFVVMTTVQLKPGTIDTVVQLFAVSNPALVASQEDWIEAKFTANREENRVTVLAFWRDADSYRAFRAGGEYTQVMSQFAPHFAGPPQVEINEVLLAM
jgi:heme-degrading monooxygenase HmoA